MVLEQQEDTLIKSVVAIYASGVEHTNKPLGSGFFIGNDGSILTCYHVLSSKEHPFTPDKHYKIYFQGQYHNAEWIFGSPDPMRLDVAILRVTSGKLPEKAKLVPLGKWEAQLDLDREYISFGYRSAKHFMGLYAHGVVRGRVAIAEPEAPLLQLSPQSPGQEEIRSGMSGAPVFYLSTNRIVGMVTTRYREYQNGTGTETIPLAIPIDAIAELWQPIRIRFKEQELYDRLFFILSPKGWFTKWALERLCEELPEFFGTHCEEFDRNHLPESLLKHIMQRRQLHTFIHWLQRRYGDQIPIEQLMLPNSYYPFVNRREELEQIMEGRPYTVLDAPIGYGKTALMRRAEVEYAKKQWLCVYSEIPTEPANCVGIGANLQEVIGGESITTLDNEKEIGKELGHRLLNTKKELDRFKTNQVNKIGESSGIVLLLDNIERLPNKELSLLMTCLLPSIRDVLRSAQVQLRVILAGHNIGPRLENRGYPLLNIIPLRPFDFDYVHDTLIQAAETKPEDANLRAAHLMHITGGHPGCMANILENMKYTWPPDLFFEEYSDKHQSIVIATSKEVKDSLPNQLKKTFETLAFFRKFSIGLISQLITHNLIAWEKEPKRLADDLTQTYLVKRRGGFLEDEIIRRLILINMRVNKPEEFLMLYNQALKIYETNIQETYFPQTHAIEAWFVYLQRSYYKFDKDKKILVELGLEERKNLHEQFFADEGIVANHLAILNEKDNGPDLVESLKSELIRDQEFAFTLNYFLRGEQYTTEPYKKLIKKITQ